MKDGNFPTLHGLDACASLAQRIRDIVLVVRRSDRRIVEANASAELTYGLSRAQLLERTLADLRAPQTVDDVDALLAEHASDSVTEERHRRVDGSVFPAEVSSQAWYDAGEAYVLYIIRDVSERYRAHERVLRARDRALEASQAKSAFVATTSHEIRNPMSVIIGMTELLLETSLDDEQRNYAATLLRAGQSLLDLMNDVLDFSKIEAGKVTIEEMDFSLRALLDDVGATVRPHAQTKGIAFEVRVDGAIADGLYGDAQKVRQILLNLVTNALKFTDAGAISIRVMPLDDAAGLSLRFEVTDTGVGIDPSHKMRLFEPYEQDRSHGRKTGGTGLGLAIARRFVELLGGEIGVESTHGLGSTFWFTAKFGLGATPLPGAPAANIWKSSDAPGTRRGHLLVVEDIVPNQHIVLAQLARLGYTADVASNGRDAVTAALSGRFDAILMDVQLPHLNGFAATEAIRARSDVAQVPIIAMTAGATADDRRQCFASGMNDFLSKPVRLRDLEAALSRALLAPDAASVHSAIEPARLDELFEGDRDAVRDVVQLAVAACRTSLERLEREIASRNTDGAASAHQLRGTAFNLGADALARSAGLLQAEITGERWAAAARLLEECGSEFARVYADAERMYGTTTLGAASC